VSFAAISLCVASQRVFIIVVAAVYFVTDSVRKLSDPPSYNELVIVSKFYKSKSYFK